jgi:hypothetical protein
MLEGGITQKSGACEVTRSNAVLANDKQYPDPMMQESEELHKL